MCDNDALQGTAGSDSYRVCKEVSKEIIDELVDGVCFPGSGNGKGQVRARELTCVPKSVEDLSLQQMCIDDISDSCDDAENIKSLNAGSEIEPVSNVVSESTMAITEQERLSALESLQAELNPPKRASMGVSLCSYFIDVFDEPAEGTDDRAHVASLLREYQRREGCSVASMMDR